MLKPEESVLIVVDVQGKLAEVMYQSESLKTKLTGLILGTQLFDIPIIWLEQLPEKLGPTVEPLNSLLSQSTKPIKKHHFSAAANELFQSQLAKLNRKQVILAGIETHVCVYQTCQDLLAQHYQVHIVSDCVSSRTAENKILGVQMMVNNGAVLTGLESLLFELQHEAQGERFKKLLKIIK